ncbi:LOW QUALITY PROTEIN: Hypothetical protein PHPALM_3622 [Phytophthora palmivora]|uniref:Uncharacterized protein n=1 Tax=Phytophthora palmivora TaxID=4796 RepID=A0A2P4YLW8_9STRA|nr:LOW QUALITY PROTEIN: Hypothetical protein PHPALM_3622 [Phytophthora palmivora]
MRNSLLPITFEPDVVTLDLHPTVSRFHGDGADHLLGIDPQVPDHRCHDCSVTMVGCLRQATQQSQIARRQYMLLTLIQAMIEGWLDSDLLLDPFFLNFPKRIDEFPGIEARRANLDDPQCNRREPTDVLETLAEADTATLGATIIEIVLQITLHVISLDWIASSSVFKWRNHQLVARSWLTSSRK